MTAGFWIGLRLTSLRLRGIASYTGTLGTSAIMRRIEGNGSVRRPSYRTGLRIRSCGDDLEISFVIQNTFHPKVDPIVFSYHLNGDIKAVNDDALLLKALLNRLQMFMKRD